MTMMAYSRQYQGVICLLFLLATLATAIEYMDLLCGETISAGDSGGVLKSQSSYNYDIYEDCTVTIEAHSGRRILLTFDLLDIEGSGYSCPSDYLRVYDGSSSYSSTIGGDICGTTTPDDITSRRKNIALRFKTDGSLSYRGFTIAYTSFKDGWYSSCDIGEFKCHNGRCIDSSLEYNGYDNCGDNSDEGSDDGSSNFGGNNLDHHNTKRVATPYIVVGCTVPLVVFAVTVGIGRRRTRHRVCRPVDRRTLIVTSRRVRVLRRPQGQQPTVATLQVSPRSQPSVSGQPEAYPAQPPACNEPPPTYQQAVSDNPPEELQRAADE